MLIYNVPATLAHSYADRNIIIRSPDSETLAEIVSGWTGDNLHGIQLLGLSGQAEPLRNLVRPVPVEIVLHEQMDEYGLLYAFHDLGEAHPICANLTVTPGFQKAVKVAVSLGFAVRLQVTQPDRDLVEEMKSVLEYYLHQTTVDQPVQFFHGLLVALYDESAENLWNIQCEDPSLDRYVTATGEVVLSRRLDFLAMPDGESTFLDDLRLELLTERGECSTCSFFTNCIGYFKFPDRKYSCTYVKELLTILKEAGSELRQQFGRYEP